jgi:hypothetical protein
MMLALIGGDFSSTITDKPALSASIFDQSKPRYIGLVEEADLLAIRW